MFYRFIILASEVYDSSYVNITQCIWPSLIQVVCPLTSLHIYPKNTVPMHMFPIIYMSRKARNPVHGIPLSMNTVFLRKA